MNIKVFGRLLTLAVNFGLFSTLPISDYPQILK
jgi:hypothetical protein